MVKYNSYPEYNLIPSGLLSSAPSSWDIKRLKYISSINDDVLPESTPPDSEFNYVDIGSVSVDKGIVRTEPMKFKDAPSRARRKVKTGDVIVSTVRTYLKAIAAIDRNADSLVVSTGFCVIRPRRGVVPRYCGYLMQAPFLVEQIVSESVGVSYPAINASQIANMKVPLPTEKEQTQIATFLDSETAKIDLLIEKQQRLIKLLEEKRQAVISHAVTKGLNPDAPMKDSGVEWLGEVPQHWSISKLGYHASKIGSGKTPSGGSTVYQDSGILFIRSQNVYDDGLRISSDEAVYINETTHKEMIGTSVLNGDLLLNITGASIGRSCLVKELNIAANVNQHVCIIRVPEVINDYLSLALQSDLIQEQIDLQQTGANREGLNFEQIANFVITIPPKNEMSRIVGHINSNIQSFKKLNDKSAKAIELLKERRTALIYAAVTGKIDVRDQVPQDVEEAVAS